MKFPHTTHRLNFLAACLAVLGLTVSADLSIASDPTPPPSSSPSSAPTVVRIDQVQADLTAREVRFPAEALAIDAPLEFFCVLSGTAEHESVFRSPVKPSSIHTALLLLGLKPGTPLRFDEPTRTWHPPTGPEIGVFVRFERDNQTVELPANAFITGLKKNQQPPDLSFVFVGSRVMPDGVYAADTLGYVIAIVNFELALLDVPALASSANETLLWKTNLAVSPPRGSPVTLILRPTLPPSPPPSTPNLPNPNRHP